MIWAELRRLAGNIWDLTVDIWTTGNHLARWAIVLIVSWPFLLLLVAMTGSGILTSLVSLVPVLIILLTLMMWISPGTLAVITVLKRGRTTLRAFATIIGMELVLGIYCALVPIQENRGLAIVVLLIFWALIFLSIGLKTKRSLAAIGFLSLILVILTASFFFSGVTKAAKVALKRTNDRVEERVKKGEGFFSAIEEEYPKSKAKDDEPARKEMPPAPAPEKIEVLTLTNDWIKFEPEPGKLYRYIAPHGTFVKYADGTGGPVNASYGEKSGPRLFSGPAGQKLIIQVFPR